MANQSWSSASNPAEVFVATNSGAIDRTDSSTPSGGMPIKHGVILLDSTSALAMTLAAPVAGSPAVGGDDGSLLQIIVAVSAALTAGVTHTVSCGSGAINGGTFSTITLDGSAGESISLVAYGGYWWKYIGSAMLS